MSDNISNVRLAMIQEISNQVRRLNEAAKENARNSESLIERMSEGYVPGIVGMQNDLRPMAEQLSVLARLADVAGIEGDDIEELLRGGDMIEIARKYK